MHHVATKRTRREAAPPQALIRTRSPLPDLAKAARSGAPGALRCLLLAFLALWPTGPAAQAQLTSAQITAVTDTTSTPIPGAGHDYVKLFGETVDPANGSVDLHIDIPIPRGRGITIPLSYIYNSNAVGHFGAPSDGPGDLWWSGNYVSDFSSEAGIEESGWTLSGPMISDYHAQRTTIIGTVHYTCDYTTDYVFTSPTGVSHNLNLSWYPGWEQSNCQKASNPPLRVSKNGGDEMVIARLNPMNGNGYPNIVVADLDGTRYNFGNQLNDGFGTCPQGCPRAAFPTSIEDRNGNVIVETNSTLVRGTTDTLGRSSASGMFGTLTNTGWNYNATNTLTVAGFSSPYVVQWQSVGGSGYSANWTRVGPNNSGGCSPGPVAGGGATGVKSITLPNGKAYQFTYDSVYGRINKIVYPTGAVITYTWGTSPSSEFMQWADAHGASQGCEMRYTTAVVTKRTVSFDGVNTALEQDFTYSTTWNTDPQQFWTWTQKQTTVVTRDCVPTGNCSTAPNFTTVYKYVPCTQSSCPANDPDSYPPVGGGEIPLESSITYYDWNGALLRTVTKAAGVFGLSRVTTQTENNLVSETDYVPDSVLPTETDDYDWGSGAKGSLLRKKTFTYANYSAYFIYDAVTQASTFDGSSNLVAQTNVGYDQTAVSPTSGVINHDYTNYSSSFVTGRANPTTVTHCIVASGACASGSPTTTYIYDDDGQPTSMTDPCGNPNGTCADMIGSNHTTTYSRANVDANGISNFTTLSGGQNVSYTPAGNVDAYLTQVTDALGHTQNFKYDFYNGQLTQSTDANSQISKYIYNDVFSRPTQANYPDQGLTTISYNDASYNPATPSPSVTTTTAISSGVNKVSTVAFDGIDHTVEAILSDPDTPDYTNTTYYGTGTVYQVSNPHRSTSSPSDGTTVYTYDALGRTTKVTEPDGSTILTTYDQINPNSTGICTTVTDEALKSRQSCADGLGRMTGVWEDPGSSPHLNYETDYTYDPLDNLLSATQKGSNSANARIRTFRYDSLSHLTQAVNPESGTIGYTYDANGNVASKTSPAPNQPSSTSTQAISYCYEALNRVISKWYTSPTCTQSSTVTNYTYDQTTSQGLAITNGVGRRTGMSDPSGNSAWSYDPMGRVAVVQRTISGFTRSATYAPYNLDGSLNVVTTFDGNPNTRSQYSYNSAGRIVSIVDPSNSPAYNFVTGATYTPNGALAKAVYDNNGSFAGITETRIYNNRLQPCWIYATTGTALAATTSCTTRDSSPANVLDLQFNYGWGSSDNGNVLQITNNRDSNRTQNFLYDPLNRIWQAYTNGNSPLATSWGETFSPNSYAPGTPFSASNAGIDAWGNLTNSSGVTGKTYTELRNFAPANASNQLNGFCHDAAGNLVLVGGNCPTPPWNFTPTYTYDAENRLASAGGATYTYDGDGNRVVKMTGSTGTLYWRGADGETVTETDATNTIQRRHLFFAGRRIFRADNKPTWTAHFYFSDHLGSSNVIANATTGAIEDESDFYPYGGEGVITNTVPQNYKFTGKERDAESGLDYFGERHYGSSLGRFMSPDPVFFQASMLTDPQRFNMYSYVRNSPLNLVDPTGESIELICIDATKCAEQRQQELQVLQNAVGKEAGSYLYENAVTTTDGTTKYYVGVRDGTGGQASVFGQMNSVAGELAPIIADTKNVQLNVVSAGTTVTDDFGNSHNINARTPAATGIFGGNLRVNFLDPSVPYLPVDSFMMSNGQLGQSTPGIVVGHELGHGRAIMTGKLPAETNPDSLRLENKVRTLQNPGAAQRLIHDCPPGACGSVPK